MWGWLREVGEMWLFCGVGDLGWLDGRSLWGKESICFGGCGGGFRKGWSYFVRCGICGE